MASQLLLNETTDFLASHHRMLIGGAWVDAASGETIDVFNPATEEIIASVPAAGEVDIDKAVAVARKAFDTGPWPAMSPSRRGELLWALADLVEDHADLFNQVEVLDNGMPYNPAGAMAGPRAAKTLRYYAGWPTKISGLTVPADTPPGADHPGVTYVQREPIGVVGQIIPWNFPLGMAVMKLGPALATGCTIVLKPAELTPLSALLLGQLVEKAGFPEGVVNIVPGYGDPAGQAIAAHPDVDKVAFTGSTAVGRKIIHAASGNMKKVSLELGGKSPFIIFPDADLDKAIASAGRLAFFLQGQNCMCASRLFIHNDIYDRVVDGVAKIAAGMTIGPGLDPETNIGPLISAAQLDRVQAFVESGSREGATLVTGGNRLDRAGHFMAPAIFADARPEMKIVREEIFGPVTCAQRFAGDDLESVARQANDTIYGLIGSVWTRDLETGHKMAGKIRAGTIGINYHGPADISAPFGGFKQSGWGREFGAEGLNQYLESKTVVTRF